MQIISFRASGAKSRGFFLCGGQMADKNEKRKAVTTHI
jgi:hypothetical protein